MCFLAFQLKKYIERSGVRLFKSISKTATITAYCSCNHEISLVFMPLRLASLAYNLLFEFISQLILIFYLRPALTY